MATAMQAAMGRRDSSAMYSYSPQEFSKLLNNSLDVFQPNTMSPVFGWMLLQFIIRSSALYNEDKRDLDAVTGKHFGDSFAWPHLVSMFDLFNFDVQDARDRIGIIMGGMLSIILCMRALFGSEGAWRLWNAIFEAAVSGTKIDFPDKAEPVAVFSLAHVDDAPGWDEYFPQYETLALRHLEKSVDQAKAARWWQSAVALPSTAYPRVAMDGFLRVVHAHKEIAAAGEPLEGFGEVYDSVAINLARKNQHLLSLAQTDQVNTALHGGGYRMLLDPETNPAKARGWSSKMLDVFGDPLSQVPHFPVPSAGIGILSRLTDNQRYGYNRAGVGETPRPHSGLDIPAPKGKPAEAMLAGIITAIDRDEKEGEGHSAGNFVKLKTELRDSSHALLGVFVHEYYHLDSVNKALDVGDHVQRGQLLGGVGNTGNSTGDHLHITTYWHQVAPDGTEINVYRLDPEQVLRRGVLAVVRSLRLLSPAFGEPRPHLAVPLFVLQSVTSGGYNSPLSYQVQANADRFLAQSLPTPPQGGAPTPPASGAPSVKDGARSASGASGESLLDDAQKEVAKELGKKALKAIAPAVLEYGIIAALGGAGVPPQVSAVIASLITSAIKESASGEPGEVIATVAQQLPMYAGEHEAQVNQAWPQVKAFLFGESTRVRQ